MIHRFFAFFHEVRGELGKVSWSSRKELVNATWVVLFSSAFLAVAVGIFDLVFTTLVQIMLR